MKGYAIIKVTHKGKILVRKSIYGFALLHYKFNKPQNFYETVPKILMRKCGICVNYKQLDTVITRIPNTDNYIIESDMKRILPTSQLSMFEWITKSRYIMELENERIMYDNEYHQYSLINEGLQYI